MKSKEMITLEDRKLLAEFMGREIKQDSDLGDLEHSLPIEFMFEVIRKIQRLGYNVVTTMTSKRSYVIFFKEVAYKSVHEDFSMAAALAALQIIRLNKDNNG